MARNRRNGGRDRAVCRIGYAAGRQAERRDLIANTRGAAEWAAMAAATCAHLAPYGAPLALRSIDATLCKCRVSRT